MSKQTQYKKCRILGVEVDAVTIPQAITYITDRAANHRQPAAFVTKPYVEFLDRAAKQPQLAALLNQSELCLPDGVALKWAAHYLYSGRRGLGRLVVTLLKIILQPSALNVPLPDRIGGINFTKPLLETARDRNLKVFLVGSPKHQSITQTAAVIRQEIPGLQVVGQYQGHFPPGDLVELIEHLVQTGPELILVGMGFPQQEHLMAQLAQKLPYGLLIGEGGTFDYQLFGGRRRRAARWVQSVGLEWLWRLGLEPWRLKRQLAIPRFIWRVYRQKG